MLDDLQKQLKLNAETMQAVIATARKVCPAYLMTGQKPDRPCTTCLHVATDVVREFVEHLPAEAPIHRDDLSKSLSSVDGALFNKDR